jgi:hypothetical protein
MEKNNLSDETIRKNIDLFNDSKPPEGHEMRFSKKLNERFHRHNRFTVYSVLKIAAIVVLAALSTLWVIEKTFAPAEKKGIALKDVSAGYAEVEVYYTSEINSRLNELSGNPAGGEMIRNDLMKKEFHELDSLYNSLQNELLAKPGDERIIDAMITYYKTKLDILNRIVEQLNKAKQLKTDKNENSKVISGNYPSVTGRKMYHSIII